MGRPKDRQDRVSCGYKALLVGIPDGLLIPLQWISPTTRAMHQFGRSRFENGCGSYPSWLYCVSCPDVRFSEVAVIFMVSTAFAVAFGVFRENKHRSWFHAANVAAMRYLFNQKWDVYTLQSFIGVTPTQVYQAWAAQEKTEALTDVLLENAKLHWIGPRQEGSQGRVMLFFLGVNLSLSQRFPRLLIRCSQVAPSSCLHDPTIFYSCKPSKMLYQLPWATSALPLWSIVSSLALFGASRRSFLSVC